MSEREDMVVWLGSLGSTGEMWEPQLAHFDERFRCECVELPGHGGESAGAGPYTIEGLGDRVVDVLDALGVESAHVVGLSIGAMIAMSLGIRHGDRVASLGLLCTSAYLPPRQGWIDRAATVRAEGAGAVAPAVVGRWLTAGYAESHADEVASFVSMISSCDAEAYASCCEAIAGMDLSGDLDKIDGPTLVIAGRHDPATPPEHGERIAGGIDGAALEIVDGAHLASWECAGEVNELLAHHLEGARR